MKFRLALLLLVLLCCATARADRLISVNVRDADVVDVIRLLAAQSGTNVITQGPLKAGKITMYLRGVPFDRALRVVLQTYHLEAQAEGNIMIVRESAGQIKKYHPKQRFRSAARVFSVRTMEGGTLNTRTISVHSLKPSDVLKRLEGTVSDGSYVADDDAGTLTVTGTAHVQAKAKAAVAALDVETRKVDFDIEIVDIVPGTNDTSIALPNSRGYALVRNSRDIDAWLNPLMQRGSAQLLAAPHLATLDNRRAELVIRQTCPEVFYDPKVGEQVEFVQFGVNLRMTPTIGREGGVTTQINPEYSAVVGSSEGSPIFGNRSIDATLRVETRQTIVFGGPLNDIDAGILSKVPALAADPIFGKVLRQRSRTHQKDVIVFLITPRASVDRGQPPRDTGSRTDAGKRQPRVPVSHRR